MNDLVNRLWYRVNNPSAWPEGFDQSGSNLIGEAADHIEAQNKLIEELASCLQWMVDNDETNEGDEPLQDHGGKTWNELNEYWIEGLNRARSAISKASKSNPNTPERNDK